MSADVKAKKVFVVLGMARTGTSAISRALKVFGINLGNSLTEGNADWNPTGFWEDKEIVYGVNGKLFSRLNFAPYGLLTIPADDQTGTKTADIRGAARRILTERLKYAEYFGFKDPSTIKVVPFWRAVFCDLQLDDYYIIALRHPLAAARSYQKLTGCELELGLLLWCAHLMQAVEATHGLRRMIVSYDILLQDPRRQLDRIAAIFQLGEVNEQEAEYYAREFLNQKLNRFQSSDDEFSVHPATQVASLCVAMYECLLQAAQDELPLDSDAFASRWQQITAEYKKLYPMYAYLDRLLKKRNHLKRKLRDTRKSYLWKLLSPLMKIDFYFRERRRMKHLQERAITEYV